MAHGSSFRAGITRRLDSVETKIDPPTGKVFESDNRPTRVEAHPGLNPTGPLPGIRVETRAPLAPRLVIAS
jgi:hypothetical protein